MFAVGWNKLSTKALTAASSLMLCACASREPVAFEGNPMPADQVSTFMQVLTSKSEYDIPPQLAHGYAPRYPPQYAKTRHWGYALLEFNIEPDGSTSGIRMISARALAFAQEAALAVERWQFTPARKNGQPVAVRVRLPFTFRV
ncbi:MAG TPA: energy transducer TonB [Chthoniobacterales bacterium]|jgi:TonB family protein|nr:energy transducer TonB [Chthoniobacterales bacterium]